MTYVSQTRRQRRIPGMAGAYTIALGDGDGFSWGDFATSISSAAAASAASAGIASLTKAIGPKPPTQIVPASTATAALTSSAGGIPIWGWAVGGLGLVLVLVMAMRR
jgi:hypothetical protein